jgi:dynein intermediate chain 1
MERRQSNANLNLERKSSMSGGTWNDGSNLTEEEKNATIDRILKSNNPNVASTPVYFDYKKDAKTFKFMPTVDHTAVHLALDGNTIRSDSEEARRLAEERKRREEELLRAEEAEKNPDLVEKGYSTKILKNQFNYSERASQTLNNPLRKREAYTDPPPSITFTQAATQWEMYDAYEEDARMANERAAAGRRRGGKEEEKRGREARGGDATEDVFSSPALLAALKIMERMVNQNDSHDIIDDYKYWEDESDNYKDDGNLLPLWKFHSEKVKKRSVTSIAWNPTYTDMFAVGYGSYDFLKQGTGMIQCFTLKNAFPTASQGPSMPAHPEYFFQLDSGVMAIDFHPKHSSLLACGLYDGSVCVFDLRQKNSEKKLKPVYASTVKTGKHTDPVWEVHWSKDDVNLQFFSISSDGRVTSWTLAKNELQFADVMKLTMSDVAADPDEPESALIGLSGGMCFDFSKENENLFIVGTAEGLIRRCSKAYNAQYLDTLEGHHQPVYAVRWNTFHPDVFLSCSADWTVKLWESHHKRPLMSFDLSDAVGDVVWSPYSSTVFAAVTTNGKVLVYDLNKNKNEPLCSQGVVKNAKLTRLCFNPKEPIILVGDSRGTVLSLKLSPNLRRKVKLEKNQPDDPASLRKLEVDKLNRLIEITLKDRELLDE